MGIMTEKISIRNAKFAKIGLQDLITCLISVGVNFKDFVMVEIGSYAGDSAQIFAPACKELYCVDPWQNGYDPNDAASHLHPMHIVEKQFDNLVEMYGNIIKFKKRSDEAVNLFNDAYFDLAYIDGEHTYDAVKEDIGLWMPKIKKTGWIAGHDYGSKHHPGVKKAVEEMVGTPDITFKDTSWLKKI